MSTTPAAELRDAARLIRETGADVSANEGRWDGLFPDSRAPHIRAINAYVRTMRPALAEDLAGILDGAAALIGQHPDLAREHVDGEPCNSPHCQIVTHALAVARAVLGSTR